jgi:hypothetical protein
MSRSVFLPLRRSPSNIREAPLDHDRRRPAHTKTTRREQRGRGVKFGFSGLAAAGGEKQPDILADGESLTKLFCSFLLWVVSVGGNCCHRSCQSGFEGIVGLAFGICAGLVQVEFRPVPGLRFNL